MPNINKITTPNISKTAIATNATLKRGAANGRTITRNYHHSSSVKSLNALKHPAESIKAFKHDAHSYIQNHPKLIKSAVLLEHTLRNDKENPKAFITQSTPEILVVACNIATYIEQAKKFGGISKLAPTIEHEEMWLRNAGAHHTKFSKVRTHAKYENVDEMLKKARKKDFSDLENGNGHDYISGNFGIAHSFVPNESTLDYLTRGSNCTSSARLENIALSIIENALQHAHYTERQIDEIMPKVFKMIKDFDGPDKSTVVYYVFDPKNADKLGYHARPFGKAAKVAKLSKALEWVYDEPEKEKFSKLYGSKTQARLCVTPHLLTPGNLEVINISNKEHMKDINALMDNIDVPEKLTALVGEQKTSPTELMREERFDKLHQDADELKKLIDTMVHK